MYLEINANSKKGLITNSNEDMILLGKICVRNATLSKRVALSATDRFIVALADGMGGYQHGEEASENVLKWLSDFFYSLPKGLSIEKLMRQFKGWVQKAHKKLLTESSLRHYRHSMGTTLVGLILYEKKVLWINCGDSRVYHLRGQDLNQLSTDHSLRQMAGYEDAPANVVMNSIGAGESVFLDMEDITEAINEEDAFLLCSDGLTNTLEDPEIETMLTEASVDDLVNLAKEAGADDDVSVGLVKILDL